MKKQKQPPEEVRLSLTTKEKDAVTERLEIEQAKRARYPKTKSLMQDDQDRNPEERACCAAHVFYSFVTALISLGSKRPLLAEDLWDLAKQDTVKNIKLDLNAHWEAQRKKRSNPSLFNTILFHYLASDIVRMTTYSGLAQGCQIFLPFVLQRLIQWLGGTDGSLEAQTEGWVLTLMIFALALCSSLIDARANFLAARKMTQLRAGVCGVVYAKALKINGGLDPEEAEDKGKGKSKGKGKRRGKGKGKKAEAGGDDADTDKTDDKGEQGTSVGQIVNLMSSDAENIGRMAYTAANSFILPIQVVVLIGCLVDTLGVSCLPGLFILLLTFPVMGFVLFQTSKHQNARAQIMDSRVKLTNEVLQGIRVVKFYAWEPPFIARIRGFRTKELKSIFQLNMLTGTLSLTFSISSGLMIFTTFATYAWLGNDFKPDVVFRAVAFFNALTFPMVRLPSALSDMVSGAVSARRVQTFLERPEMQPLEAITSQQANVVVEVNDASFSWQTTESDSTTLTSVAVKESESQASGKGLLALATNNALSGVNFVARQGQITAVVGPVASGKSSLLSGILGELKKTQGTVACKGRVALVAQTAWIQNDTIRENILFGEPFEPAKYERVLEVCALLPDLAILPAADFTEIGDRGINLSGGQKQRIAIARAVYQDADVYLFDDPLSAVDAHVAEHIFQKCVAEMLATKCVILVTNQLQFLQRCHRISVMKDGTLAESGTFAELSSKESDFHELMQAHRADMDHTQADKGDLSVASPSGLARLGTGESEAFSRLSAAGRATLSQHSPHQSPLLSPAGTPRISDLAHVPNHRTVSGSPRHPISAPGTPAALVPLSLGVTRRSRQSLSSLAKQLDRSVSISKTLEARRENDEAAVALGKAIEKEEMFTGSVAGKVYVQYFKAAGGAWLSFIAFVLFMIAQALLSYMFLWLASWTSDEYKQPQNWYIAGMGILVGGAFIICYLRNIAFAHVATEASRNLHQGLLMSVMRGSARFYDATPLGRILNRFSKDITNLDSTLPRFFLFSVGMVATVVLNLVGVVLVSPWFALCVFVAFVVFFMLQRFFKPTCIQLQRLESNSRSPIYAHFGETLTGLSTVRAMKATARFLVNNEKMIDLNSNCYLCIRFVFQWATVRVGMINAFLVLGACAFAVISAGTVDPAMLGASITMVLSSSQIFGFLIILLTELENQMNSVERIQHYCETIPPEAPWTVPEEDAKIPKTWPSEAKLKLRNVHMQYRPDLEPAIKGVSIDVESQEKLGVVGRTGSGKSSTLLALLRMYPLSQGSIEIDGVDISKIGLHTLRRALAIIPQDPVVFSGDVRNNLDPFTQCSDEEIWTALANVNLKECIEGLNGQLTASVEEHGRNFSQGQRQLLCMARALLRKPKILLMDEATSSIDVQTDRLLQKMVRTQFGASTVITVAHRLNTIMDSTRVLVLDQGVVAEHDAPKKLCAQKGGLFAGMVATMQEGGEDSNKASDEEGGEDSNKASEEEDEGVEDNTEHQAVEEAE